ncbi:hypothetical protein ADUPG1_002874, partial [Aduncisulcus paluster]
GIPMLLCLLAMGIGVLIIHATIKGGRTRAKFIDESSNATFFKLPFSLALVYIFHLTLWCTLMFEGLFLLVLCFIFAVMMIISIWGNVTSYTIRIHTNPTGQPIPDVRSVGIHDASIPPAYPPPSFPHSPPPVISAPYPTAQPTAPALYQPGLAPSDPSVTIVGQDDASIYPSPPHHQANDPLV